MKKHKWFCIELFGTSYETAKLLNEVRKYKGKLRNVVHTKNSVIFETNQDGLRILRRKRRTFNCKFTVEALDKFEYQLFTGFRFLLFLCIPYIASLFIWSVIVETDHPEIENDIEQKLRQFQIKRLQLKSNLPEEDELRRSLLQDEDRLSWIRFEKSGSQFTVIPMQSPQVELDKEVAREPSHLIAKTAGVITHFALTKGEKSVSLHSTVKKGDILATGILEQGEEEVVVGAEGFVYANYWLEYSFSLPREMTFKKQGQEKLKLSFQRPKLGKNLFNKENWNIIEADQQITQTDTTIYLKEGMEKSHIIPIVKLQLQRELGYEAIVQKEELLTITYDEEKVYGKIVFLVNDNIATYDPIKQGD